MSWKLPRGFASREPAAYAPPAPLVAGLGARLSYLCALVPQGARVVDVGTDHARLPAALLETKRATRAIAIDAAKEPLRQAEARATAAGVELRHGEGLEPLAPSEADVAIFAGLGGDTIATALIEGAPAALGLTKILAQPNTDPHRVRRALHAAGYELTHERFVADERRFFLVMVAERTIEPRTLTDADLDLGPSWARTEDRLYELWLERRRRPIR